MKKNNSLLLSLSSIKLRQSIFIFLISVSATLVGQTLELTSKSGAFAYTGDVVFIACDGHLKNLSVNPEDSMITWERTMNLPSKWTVSVCDIANCWFPQLSTNTFKMKPGQEGLFDLNVYPQNEEGNGTVTILMYYKNKKAAAQTFVFDVTAKAPAPAAVDEVKENGMKVWPNPFSSNINIMSNIIDAKGYSYAVVNLMGVEVKKDQLSPNAPIDLSALKTGGYILSIYKDGKMQHHQFILKSN